MFQCYSLRSFHPRLLPQSPKVCSIHLCLFFCLDSPLESKEIPPVHCKGNRSWIVIGRTDVEAESPILWPPDMKNWLTEKDPVAGKDWRWEEKGSTEDEMVGWHHQLNRREFEQTLGAGDGQGGLGCCSQRGCKELDATERLNWTDNLIKEKSNLDSWDLSHLYRCCYNHWYHEKLLVRCVA